MKAVYTLVITLVAFFSCSGEAFGVLANDASFIDESWNGFTGLASSRTIYAGGDANCGIGWFANTGIGASAPFVDAGEAGLSMLGASSGLAIVKTGELGAYRSGLFPDQYIVTTRVKIGQFPDTNISSGDLTVKGISLVDVRRDFRLIAMLSPTALWVQHSGSWTEIAVATMENTFYTWQFEVNDLSGTVNIYRRALDGDPFVSIASNVAMLNQNATDQIYAGVVRYNGENTQKQGEMSIDYFLVGRPLEPPPVQVLHAAFNGSLSGVGDGGAVVHPAGSSGLAYTGGVHGQALLVGSGSDYVEYADIFTNQSGTVMFWATPEGDDTTWPTLYYNMLYAYGSASGNNEANQRIRIFVNRILDFNAYQGGSVPLKLRRYIGEIWPKGEWRHFAFSWDTNGAIKFYVNGLPYQHGFGAAQQMRKEGSDIVSLQDIQRIYLGKPPGAGVPSSGAAMAFDELEVFNGRLSPLEISAEYRRGMPVDMVMARRFLRAAEPEVLQIDIWPGGERENPRTGVLVPVPIGVALDMELATLAGTVVGSTNISLSVSQKERVCMSVGTLDAGTYRLKCSFPWEGATCQRTFAVEVYQQKSAPPLSNGPLPLGGLISSIDCSQAGSGYVDSGSAQVINLSGLDPYREAGSNKMDRFSYELDFAEHNGDPVVLDITWPDNVPRAMGFYMYRESTLPQNRDRLAGGVQSGVEYPCAGGMAKTRYLFYPWFGRYLFEARTMIPGYPAAVARIDVYSVAGRLPRLPVVVPNGEKQRLFGHMDEDQSFEKLINGELEEKGAKQKRNAIDVLESLLDYLDYTGQNAMNYAFSRYDFVYKDLPGSFDSFGLRTKGWQNLMLDMFERRGKKLIATCNSYGLPEDMLAPDQLALEYVLHDRSGNVVPNAFNGNLINPSHPEARNRFLRQIKDILEDVGMHPACGGLDLWYLQDKSPWSFHSLEYGYGDFTVGLFESETSINLGVDGASPTRFEQRYQLLTGTYRNEWLQWRAGKTTELITEIDTMIRNINPNLPLYLTLGGWGREVDHADEQAFNFTNLFYESRSMDLGRLAQLPSVHLVPLRQPTSYRWEKFKTNRENSANEIMWDPDKFSEVRATDRAAAWSFNRYFETLGETLNPTVFKSFFQSPDVKPHGRYFLQELVQAVAASDASTLLLGGQPMGMAGRDAQAREFARAYRALPAEAFADVPGSQDPVMVRYFQTGNQTYLYAANLSFLSQTGLVFFAGSTGNAVDLSTGEPLGVVNGMLSLKLNPFALRSFRLDSLVVPTNWVVDISTQNREWVQGRFNQITAMPGSPAPSLPDLVGQIQTAIDNGQFSDAYRLITSKALRTGNIPSPYLPIPGEQTIPGGKVFVDEDWNDLDVYAGDTTNRIGWTKSSASGSVPPFVGNGEVTVSSEGATGGSSALRTSDLDPYSSSGLFPSHYLVTTRVKVEQFPDIDFSAANGAIEGINLVDIRREKRLTVVLTPNELWINNSMGWTNISVNTALNTYYTWQFEVDGSGGLVNAYRRESDSESFVNLAMDIPVPSQNTTNQIYANRVFYNGDNTRLQGTLVGDYFQIKSAEQTTSVLYQTFDGGWETIPAEFYIVQIKTSGGGNLLTWYTSGDMGGGAHFSIYRATSLVNGDWIAIASGLVRSPSGWNTWEDTAPPPSPSVFYQVRVSLP